MTIFDFITEEEAETMKLHQEVSGLSPDDISKFWRDANGILCVEYLNGKWWHYSNNGEWW